MKLDQSIYMGLVATNKLMNALNINSIQWLGHLEMVIECRFMPNSSTVFVISNRDGWLCKFLS